MMMISRFILLFLVIMANHRALSFTTSNTIVRSTFCHRSSSKRRTVASSTFFLHARHSSTSIIIMRDVSASTAFQLGDTVTVVDDVIKAGLNLRGRQGVVVETWEKCSVDPSCCCAEVDRSMAIQVEFTNRFATTKGEEEGDEASTFQYNFAEEELLKCSNGNSKD
jgi:hypothetical protein